MENQIQPNIPPNQTQPLVPPVAPPPPVFSPPINPVPPPPPFQTQPQPKKNLKGLLLAVIFLLLFSGLAFVGIKLWQMGVIFKKTTKTVEESLPTPVEPTPTPDLTADWKTYTNTKYKYQLKYPVSLSVLSMDSTEQLDQTSGLNFRELTDKTPAAETGFSLFVISNPNNLQLTDWVKQNTNERGGILTSAERPISSSSATINGLIWEKIDDDSIGFVPTGNVKYGLAHSGNLYYIVIYSADAKIIDQILSTFKFITVTPTSSPSAQTKGGITTGTPVKIKSIALTTATGPLVIKGTVDTGWMFEGTMPVLLLDSSRNEIASGSAAEVTPGSWQSGKAVDFSVSLAFTTKDTSGFLVFKNDNPSGFPENQKTFELPIKFVQN